MVSILHLIRILKSNPKYSPTSIFPQIYFAEIHVTELSIALIFIFPIDHII